MNNNFEQVEDDREDCQFIKSPPKTIEPADIPQEIATRNSSEHSYSEIISNEEIIKLFIQGEKKLVYNQKLLIEPQVSVVILKEKSGQIIGLMKQNGKHNKVLIKLASEYLGILQRNLASKSFVYLGDSQEHKGFIEYKQYNVPKNYQIHYTTARALWKNWWPRQHFEQGSQIQLNLLILLGEQWYPIKNILVESGKIYIKTLVKEIILDSEDKLVWINKITEKEFLRSNSHLPVPQINSVAENHLGSENQDQQKNVQNNSLSATQKKDILLRLGNLESKLNDLTFNYQQKMTALQNEYLEEVKALRQEMSSLSQSIQEIDLPQVKETTVVKSMGEVPKSILNLVVSDSPSEDKKFDLKAWLRNSTKSS